MFVLHCKLEAFIMRASNLLSSCHGIVTPRKPKESVLKITQQTLQKQDNSQQYVKTHICTNIIYKLMYNFYTTCTLITKLKNKEIITMQNQ